MKKIAFTVGAAISLVVSTKAESALNWERTWFKPIPRGTTFSFSNNGSEILEVSSKQARVYDVATGEIVQKMDLEQKETIVHARLSVDGKKTILFLHNQTENTHRLHIQSEAPAISIPISERITENALALSDEWVAYGGSDRILFIHSLKTEQKTMIDLRRTHALQQMAEEALEGKSPRNQIADEAITHVSFSPNGTKILVSTRHERAYLLAYENLVWKIIEELPVQNYPLLKPIYAVKFVGESIGFFSHKEMSVIVSPDSEQKILHTPFLPTNRFRATEFYNIETFKNDRYIALSLREEFEDRPYLRVLIYDLHARKQIGSLGDNLSLPEYKSGFFSDGYYMVPTQTGSILALHLETGAQHSLQIDGLLTHYLECPNGRHVITWNASKAIMLNKRPH